MNTAKEISEIESIIQSVTTELGKCLPKEYYEIIDRGIPHQPEGLPKTKMGVYMFEHNGTFLKIGKAGPRSMARFLSQHYSASSAQSTLAKSILKDDDFKSLSITSEDIGDWIKTNCRRIDILIDENAGIFALNLIEALLHYIYIPKYEGTESQCYSFNIFNAIKQNAMLGAVLGDIIGSVYEFGTMKRVNFPLFSEDSSYTDDTIMTFAVMDWLVNKNDLIQTMQRYGKMYPCPMGGYGSGFSKWLRAENPQPYDSWGNGSAMRVSPIGWAYPTLYETLEAARQTAIVSHNHPEGIKGAQATAASIFLARSGKSKEEIRQYIEITFDYNLRRSCDEIRPDYRFNESCQETVPEAIIAFLDSTDFENAIRLAVSLGGDSDTLACITGGIAEAFYGVPEELQKKAEAILPRDFLDLLNRFHQKFKEYIADGKNNMLLRSQKINVMKQVPLRTVMLSVLEKNGRSMYPKDLAEEIRKRGLYFQKDGTPLKDGHIHAMVSNCKNLFTKIDGKVTINDKTENSPSSIGNIEAFKYKPTTASKDEEQEVIEAKKCCETIESKQKDLKIAEEIIEKAYAQLKTKIGACGICEQSKKTLQAELESILIDLGNRFEFRSEDEFPLTLGYSKHRVDILIHYNSIRAAIKVEIFKKGNVHQSIYRYDVFKNLLNLENDKANGTDLCYFMLVTDDTHYVDPEKEIALNTGDFDFRDGVKYVANTRLVYRTDVPYGPPICLKQSYIFKWDKINQLNFLKVKV